ncbi:MAG: hypothetical protein ACP5P7_07070, partial [Sulfurihydrogenibium sp.]
PANFVKIISGFEPKSIISTEYQDFQLKPDFVVELINGDILHIEFQRTNDPMMVYRMLGYYYMLKTRFKDRKIIQVVLYIGDKPMSMANQLNEDGISYSFKIIDTRDIPCESLVNSDNISDLILASICDIKNPVSYFEKLYERLITLSERERIRYLKLLTNLLRGRKLLKQALEVEKMKILLTKEEILEDPLYKMGEEKGIQKAIQIEIQAILDILSLKFSNEDLSDISEKLKKIENLETLDYLRNKAKTVSSLEEFKQLLE